MAKPNIPRPFDASAAIDTAEDRRRSERHVTIFRTGKITRAAGDELCLVRNISAGGAMAHVFHAPDLNEEILLDLRMEEQIRGRIVWVRDEAVGIAFDRPIDLADVLGDDAADGRRARAPRVKVPAIGKLQVGDDFYRIVTDDVSQSGMRIFCAATLTAGAEVRLWVDGLSVFGSVVRWARDGVAGLSFNQPLPIRQLTRWLREQRARDASPIADSPARLVRKRP